MIKRLRVIIGPNGSGKTTLFRQLSERVETYDFINADEIKAVLRTVGRLELPFEISSDEFRRAYLPHCFDESSKEFICGHDVPDTKIKERYIRCLDNFYDSLQYAYRAYFFDNSAPVMRFFAELKPDGCMEIVGKIPQWFQKCILDKVRV